MVLDDVDGDEEEGYDDGYEDDNDWRVEKRKMGERKEKPRISSFIFPHFVNLEIFLRMKFFFFLKAS